MTENRLELIREQKLLELAQLTPAYPERFEKTHEIKDVTMLVDGTKQVKTAGRIMSIRKMGKLCFLTIADINGKIQIAIRKDVLGEEQFDFFKKYFDIGDFIGVMGEIFTTNAGEKTIRAESFDFLGKALKPLPEKFHGINDIEACYRQRYLDLVMNEDTQKRFLLKSQIVKSLRRYLEDNSYIEIETPALNNKASGALAKPFAAHHNALDIDVYLRIAPETYLKRAIVGGFTKVFEFARCFRNEGIDATHLQDFTMLECYCAYYNYKDNMRFIKDMLCTVIKEAFGSCQVKIADRLIDFGGDWPVVSFRELILRDCMIDIEQYGTAQELLNEIKRNGIILDSKVNLEVLGKGNLIDLLYKRVSRPHVIEPTFLVEHPISLSPLARANDDRPHLTDRFQLIINGAEVINGYSELVDPQEQRQRLIEQAKLNAGGDEEAMPMDNDYIIAMQYGMPPISGWGMGIDRILQILTGQNNLRDSFLFPMMRPLDK